MSIMSETTDTRAPRRYTSERGLDRLVFFTDAISAIAITLLILPLVDLVAEVAPDSTPGSFLGAHSPELLSFALSFAVIARLWYSHHQLFEHIERYDTRLVVLDILWAFTIVLLPLPTAMINRFATEPLVIGFYIGTMTVSALSLTAMTLLVRGDRRLQSTVLVRGDRRLQSTENPLGSDALGGISASATLFVVAFLLGVLVPGMNYWALLVLFFSGLLGTVYARLLDRREAHRTGD